jgi:hypothetical protein
MEQSLFMRMLMSPISLRSDMFLMNRALILNKANELLAHFWTEVSVQNSMILPMPI